MKNNYVETEVIQGRAGWYSLLVKANGIQFQLYHDLTSDYARLENLSKRINRGSVSLIHIEDIVEDFLD